MLSRKKPRVVLQQSNSHTHLFSFRTAAYWLDWWNTGIGQRQYEHWVVHILHPLRALSQESSERAAGMDMQCYWLLKLATGNDTNSAKYSLTLIFSILSIAFFFTSGIRNEMISDSSTYILDHEWLFPYFWLLYFSQVSKHDKWVDF